MRIPRTEEDIRALVADPANAIREVEALARIEEQHRNHARVTRELRLELLDALARQPGVVSVEAALCGAYATWRAGHYSVNESRRLASNLASWQTAAVIAAVLDNPPEERERAHYVVALLDAFVQEAVLREVRVPPAAVRFTRWPLSRLESERLIELPRHRSPGRAIGTCLARATRALPSVVSTGGWTEVVPSELETELVELFDDWPNGRATVRRFVPSALRDEVDDVRLGALDVFEASFPSAFALLFGRFHGGGMYGVPRYGACARQDAWTAVRSLVGDWSSELPGLETFAKECRWFELRSAGAADFADFGVAVARRDETLCLLWVTDTD